ncbi:hypothetical protein EVAR_19962_1 [Eumeta japonica]|uniref:Uncharacterized protein n=1 Tax=Eumeta variegata TaxID=151549 RepID=A0A4C1YJ69_EUMVA|nr:hypothetical protein EVAR_19962_1 [Eumeta japonica]
MPLERKVSARGREGPLGSLRGRRPRAGDYKKDYWSRSPRPPRTPRAAFDLTSSGEFLPHATKQPNN